MKRRDDKAEIRIRLSYLHYSSIDRLIHLFDEPSSPFLRFRDVAIERLYAIQSNALNCKISSKLTGAPPKLHSCAARASIAAGARSIINYINASDYPLAQLRRLSTLPITFNPSATFSEYSMYSIPRPIGEQGRPFHYRYSIRLSPELISTLDTILRLDNEGHLTSFIDRLEKHRGSSPRRSSDPLHQLVRFCLDEGVGVVSATLYTLATNLASEERGDLQRLPEVEDMLDITKLTPKYFQLGILNP